MDELELRGTIAIYGHVNVFQLRKEVVVKFYSTDGQMALGYKSEVSEYHALQMLYKRLYQLVQITVENLTGDTL